MSRIDTPWKPRAANSRSAAAAAPDWTGRVDVSYRAKAWLSVDNHDVLTQDSFTLMNAIAMWRSSSGTWRASAGVRNLTDEVYKTDAQEFSSVGNIQTAYYGDPRTWQFTLGYSF